MSNFKGLTTIIKGKVYYFLTETQKSLILTQEQGLCWAYFLGKVEHLYISDQEPLEDRSLSEDYPNMTEGQTLSRLTHGLNFKSTEWSFNTLWI